MKANWKTKKLGEVCDMINRGISPQYTNLKGICVLNQKCIRNHKINFDLARTHDLNTKKINPEKFIQIGDVLVNSTGTGTLGRVAQVKELPFIATVDSHITIIRPQKGLFYIPFFSYALIILEEEISKKGEGCGGQIELARNTLKNDFTICFPESHMEQQRIVAILDKAFAAIDKAKENIERNLKSCRCLVDSILNLVLYNSSVKSIRCNIRDAFEIMPSKKEIKNIIDDNEYISFIPMEDLGIQSKELKANKLKKFKDAFSSYTYFSDNDLILAKITPCFENGKIGIARNLVKGIGFGSSEYIVLRSLGKIIPDYLYYFLNRDKFRQDGKKVMLGAAGHKRLPIKYLENLLISYPSSIIEQQRIVTQLDALSNETKKLEAIYQKKLGFLEELKKSILQKAFSGELTEKDASVDI